MMRVAALNETRTDVPVCLSAGLPVVWEVALCR
jgi:hypothetical protein